MLPGGAFRLRRRRAPVALALALAAGLAAVMVGGCGASSTVDPVAKAATLSNRAPGFRALFTLRLSTSALPTPITANGSGSFDVRDHSGSLSLAMNLGSIPQAAQALGSSTLRIEEIVDRLTVYIKFPGAIGRRLHGKPWLKINVAQAAQGLGTSGLSSLMNSNPTSSDPSQFLRYLRATSGGVKKVGTQSVDGFQTTHYRAQIQLDRVANSVPAADRAQVRASIAAIERMAHLRLLPVDVWVDGQHLVRRLQFVFNESVSGLALGATVRMDIPQYGPQSPPTPPPASQVTDITSAARSGVASGL